MKEIYFDNSTTTKPFDEMISSMLPFYQKYWGSPTSCHQKGQEVLPFLEEAYESLYDFLGANHQDTILLTSSTQEAINHIMYSTYKMVTENSGKNSYVTSNIEEAPSIFAIDRLQSFSCVPKMALVNSQGKVTKEAISDVITPRTALVSLSWVNSLTGVIHPIEEIGTLCKERGILFHVDVTHGIGKLYFSLEDVQADFVTFRADAIHGPKGISVLYVKKDVPLTPFIVGGPDQGNLRAGDMNVPLVMGFSYAVKRAQNEKNYLCSEIARLKTKLEQGLLQKIPEIKIVFSHEERLPHITTICFPEVANEALQHRLNEQKIYTSIGGGSVQAISLVLEASGMDPKLANTAISFSLSLFTKEEEIDEAIEKISSSYFFLKKISPSLESI